MSKHVSDIEKEGAFYRRKLLLSMIIPGIFVFLMWLVKIVEVLFDINLTRFGIYPLTVQGLPGILFSPFIHADFTHLFSNSVPLFFLSLALFYFYSEVALKVLIWTYFLTGLLVWIACSEADLGTILAIPMNAVDKIEVVKESGKLPLFGFQGSFGVISVFTKRGSNSPVQPPLNFINQRVYGYYRARTFYSPRYNVPQPEYKKPDLRTTIHWEPNVVTDEDGNATISFYNADNRATIKVDVEGIAEQRVPLVGKTSFEVK